MPPLHLAVRVGRTGGVARRVEDLLGITDAATPLLIPGGDWPNATNTGYLGDIGALTPASSSTISTPGAVYENRLVTGALYVTAPNVTIRNCVINAGFWGVENSSTATGLTIEDVTIIGGDNCGIMLDGYGANTAVQRCNISEAVDGMKISGSNIIIRDNYIHDLAFDAGADTHNDGIQCYSGTGFQFIHNWIDSPDTSCIAMFKEQGEWDDILIQSNYFTGHPAYSIYAPQYRQRTPTLLPTRNVRVLDNVFEGFVYAPVTDWQPSGEGWAWSGNVDPEGNSVAA